MGPRAALAAFFLASVPGLAAAQGTPLEEARAHFDAGTAAFDRGEYATAVTEFQAAHAITQHPDLLFNIYSAAERDGQYPLAADTLERYLAEGVVEPERRPALSQRLANLRARIAANDQGRIPPIDEGEEAGGAGPVEPAEVEPVDASPVDASPAEPVPPSPPSGGGVHPAGVALLIAGGALGLAFVGLAVGSTVEADRLANGCSPSCSDAEVSTLNALNIAADVSWITAAVAGATGLVLLFVLPPEGGEDAAVAFTPWASPDGAGIAIGGRL